MIKNILNKSVPLTSSIVKRYSTKLAYHKYPFLAELGIKEHNKAVNFGKGWIGSGKIINSVNPSTDEVIATVQQVRKIVFVFCNSFFVGY